ncbi:hypothetical protein MPER_00001, partial [Moniliophthora perniciosa FA553]
MEMPWLPGDWRFYIAEATWGYDFVTRYKHKTIPPGKNMTLAELRKEGYLLDDKAWLSRIL